MNRFDQLEMYSEILRGVAETFIADSQRTTALELASAALIFAITERPAEFHAFLSAMDDHLRPSEIKWLVESRIANGHSRE